MNPIYVSLMPPILGGRGYTWSCRLCRHRPSLAYLIFSGVFGYGQRPTIAQAADAGRAHCRRHHCRHRQTDYALVS